VTELIDFYLRQVDFRLALVARIIADPKQIIVPDESGITRVAAARQLKNRRQFFLAHVERRDFGVGTVGTSDASRRDPLPAGDADEIRTPEEHIQVVPLPIRVRRMADAEHRGIGWWFAVATLQAIYFAAAIEP